VERNRDKAEVCAVAKRVERDLFRHGDGVSIDLGNSLAEQGHRLASIGLAVAGRGP